MEISWQGGEMNQALYAHMNNKRKMKKKKGNILSKSRPFCLIIKAHEVQINQLSHISVIHSFPSIELGGICQQVLNFIP
jgi:hypothetical protein